MGKICRMHDQAQPQQPFGFDLNFDFGLVWLWGLVLFGVVRGFRVVADKVWRE